MSDVEKRLFGPALLTNAAATKYTVPTGRRAKLKQFHFFNAHTVAVGVTVSIGADGTGTRLYTARSIAAGAEWSPFVTLTMEAAEILQMYASVTSVVVAIVDGKEGILV